MDEYPATARLSRAGAGAFVRNVDDQTADRAERALLELLGRDERPGAPPPTTT